MANYDYINDFKIDEDTFIAPGARLIGDITLKKGANIWYNAVLRADVAEIVIGENTNIQDNATVHVDYGKKLCSGGLCHCGAWCCASCLQYR